MLTILLVTEFAPGSLAAYLVPCCNARSVEYTRYTPLLCVLQNTTYARNLVRYEGKLAAHLVPCCVELRHTILSDKSDWSDWSDMSDNFLPELLLYINIYSKSFGFG